MIDTLLHRVTVSTTLLATMLLAGPALAEPVYHPAGASLTFGGMTHRHSVVPHMGNPAIDSSEISQQNSLYRFGASIGGGIEYDGNDNLFKVLDQLGADDALTSGGGAGTLGKLGISLDLNNPDLASLVGNIDSEAARLSGLLNTFVEGVDAKAFVSADVPILISNDALGGVWTFSASFSLITNLKGINDPILFDSTAALAQLQSAFSANTVVAQTYNLTGGASVTVNPDGSTQFLFENDSGALTKAVEITEISIGYSRQVWQQDDNAVYLGVRPRFYSVGLANTAIPIADINDAKSIFDALDSAGFKYEQGWGIDVGAIYTGPQYQFGATVTNINEPDFSFPAADTSGFTDPVVIQQIRARETYTMQRQLKLEAGLVSENGAWGINAGVDANAVPDPMGDDYQWLSVGAGFASDSWWLPGARLGVRKNLAGTRLTYITGGLTLFNGFNLDVATTTDTVVIENRTIPRSFIINLSMQIEF